MATERIDLAELGTGGGATGELIFFFLMMRGELIGLVERGDDWESKTAAEVGRQSRALAEWIGC